MQWETRLSHEIKKITEGNTLEKIKNPNFANWLTQCLGELEVHSGGVWESRSRLVYIYIYI